MNSVMDLDIDLFLKKGRSLVKKEIKLGEEIIRTLLK